MLTLALLVAPATLLVPDARSDPSFGTPKDFCEDVYTDMLVHEYAGFGYWEREPIGLEIDGQTVVDAVYTHTLVAGRVDGSHLAPDRATNWNCSATGQVDGHFEFAVGGAILAGSGGLGGAQFCLQEQPHHSFLYYPTIHVSDGVFGPAIDFTVLSDWPRPGSETAFPCGDNILEPCPNGSTSTASCNPNDEWTYGVGGSVTPFFGTGANGAYYVFTQGVSGHVWTTY